MVGLGYMGFFWQLGRIEAVVVDGFGVLRNISGEVIYASPCQQWEETRRRTPVVQYPASYIIEPQLATSRPHQTVYHSQGLPYLGCRIFPSEKPF